MNTDELVEGQKYYFYETPPTRPERVYRATYLSIVTNAVLSYLIKRQVDPVTNQNVMHCTPLNWFTKAETLDEILSKTGLPTDVVNIIDEYL
jgi:hypothetical protein